MEKNKQVLNQKTFEAFVFHTLFYYWKAQDLGIFIFNSVNSYAGYLVILYSEFCFRKYFYFIYLNSYETFLWRQSTSKCFKKKFIINTSRYHKMLKLVTYVIKIIKSHEKNTLIFVPIPNSAYRTILNVYKEVNPPKKNQMV